MKSGFIHHVSGDNSPRGELVNLLQSWIEEGDAQEQRETGEYLIRALDEDRLSDRRSSRTWLSESLASYWMQEFSALVTNPKLQALVASGVQVILPKF